MSRQFYEQCPIGVCILRRDRRNMTVSYANPAWRRLLGLEETENAVTGKTLAEIWPNKEIKDLVHALKSPKPPVNYTLAVGDRKEAEARWAKLTIQEDEFDGEAVFILWADDVSASKKAEARLEQAVEEADAAAEVKANFLATMSHEIRTPMQSVYGLLELIGEEKPETKIKTMVDIAKNSASGLLEILDDILDFAKMDANKMELDHFEVPVRTLVRGINEALAVKVQGKNIQLRDDIAEDVPFVVIGDPKRLRQILMNLTGNALKFTKEGAVTIKVSLGGEHVSPPRQGLVLRFEVIDSGIGMKPEAASRLFQPFTQADSSTSRKYGGTGLGLSICKKLVELMGGQIGADSVEGEGSTFWFEVPTEEVGTQTTTVDLPSLDGISVLSVEDHPQGAKEIVRSLQSMGAKVESCPTYQEALDLVRRRPFDVGIIDQGLPDGLGIDLIREIVKIRPFMGLVMYTVRDDSGLQHSLNALGVTYLAKPASRLGLGETVKDAASKIVRMNVDGPTRLLIAEDTASVRDVLTRQLEKLEVEADFVENGAEAMAALKTGKYGILFTDLHMPELDGFGLVDAIREKEAGKRREAEDGEIQTHFPVIVLTADVQMTQRQTYLSYGFDECLLKPVSLGQLRRLLIRWGLLQEPYSSGEDVTPQTEDEPSALKTVSGPVGESGDQGPPAIDVEQVKSQMGAFDQGTLEMLHMFIDMTAPSLPKLKEALAHKDEHELAEIAHSLKGAARSACCNPLGDAASDLQQAAEASKGSYEPLVTVIETEFARASAAIKALKVPALALLLCFMGALSLGGDLAAACDMPVTIPSEVTAEAQTVGPEPAKNNLSEPCPEDQAPHVKIEADAETDAGAETEAEAEAGKEEGKEPGKILYDVPAEDELYNFE